VKTGGRTYVARLTDGVAKLTLAAYHTTGADGVKVGYLGSSFDRPVHQTASVRVRR
jgi:hypothetical protein